MSLPFPEIDQTCSLLATQLAADRNPEGFWSGQLSSSALSTATAIVAFKTCLKNSQASAAFEDQQLKLRIQNGKAWLTAHQNPDGGWGDTTKSKSNISTTVLCWAALHSETDSNADISASFARASQWLIQKAGGIEAEVVGEAISNQYGKDRTFSAPILTHCALAGCWDEETAWKMVRQLPFELAALPPETYALVQMPVVSYALPALIAIGQAKHFFQPTQNKLLFWIRDRTVPRTLSLLERIQPSSGGFLEATPLTSFVVMSLAGKGLATHPVVLKGMRFLSNSQREDGSWAIDTNLATWVTTLSLNALRGRPSNALSAVDEEATKNHEAKVCEWLLAQQFKTLHPYTQSPPGGWAWTDLPGGVPDADDTAGALRALHQLKAHDPIVVRAAQSGVEWLLQLQNRDGGIPTFCRGWGTLPFDWSSPDLTAHALRAWLVWFNQCNVGLQTRLGRAVTSAVDYLFSSQRSDGSWVPLWFGNEWMGEDENPVYGTSRVLVALQDLLSYCQASGEGNALNPSRSMRASMMEEGAGWLVRNQLADGGWGALEANKASIEETALAVEALAAVIHSLKTGKEAVETSLFRGVEWLLSRVRAGDFPEPAPVGFYFAKLWYWEKLYPLIFSLSAFKAVRNLIKTRLEAAIP